MSYAGFTFVVPNMTQREADALWDKILEGAEALGHTGEVKGTYKVITEKEEAHAKTEVLPDQS